MEKFAITAKDQFEVTTLQGKGHEEHADGNAVKKPDFKTTSEKEKNEAEAFQDEIKHDQDVHPTSAHPGASAIDRKETFIPGNNTSVPNEIQAKPSPTNQPVPMPAPTAAPSAVPTPKTTPTPRPAGG